MSRRYRFVISVSLLCSLSPSAAPQNAVNDIIGNQIAVSVRATTSFDNNTGIYTYSYQLTNSNGSAEAVESFSVRVGGVIMPDVLNSTSPAGWTFGVVSDRPIVTWDAIDVSGESADPSGAPPPSKAQIKPGQQLGGFSFQSHAPPGNVTYYAQGYVKGPLATPGDVDDEHAVLIPDFTEIGVNGTTTGPISSATSGPPSVRRFVVVLNPQQGSINASPIQVQLKFAIDGENVDRSTFHAELNGVDVTNRFGAGNSGVELQASFNLASMPLQAGNNDFIASVSGTNPQGGALTVGLSRVSFTVAKTTPGDVNGDGVVNCSDVAIIKAAFGKKIGHPGYDVRADVNSDGFVDVRDLAFVSQKLPSGTQCP